MMPTTPTPAAEAPTVSALSEALAVAHERASAALLLYEALGHARKALILAHGLVEARAAEIPTVAASALDAGGFDDWDSHGEKAEAVRGALERIDVESVALDLQVAAGLTHDLWVYLDDDVEGGLREEIQRRTEGGDDA